MLGIDFSAKQASNRGIVGVWGIYFTEIFFHFFTNFFLRIFQVEIFRIFFGIFFRIFFHTGGPLAGELQVMLQSPFYGTFLVLLIYNYLSWTMTGQLGSGGTHGAGFPNHAVFASGRAATPRREHARRVTRAQAARQAQAARAHAT